MLARLCFCGAHANASAAGADVLGWIFPLQASSAPISRSGARLSGMSGNCEFSSRSATSKMREKKVLPPGAPRSNPINGSLPFQEHWAMIASENLVSNRLMRRTTTDQKPPSFIKSIPNTAFRFFPSAFPRANRRVRDFAKIFCTK